MKHSHILAYLTSNPANFAGAWNEPNARELCTVQQSQQRDAATHVCALVGRSHNPEGLWDDTGLAWRSSTSAIHATAQSAFLSQRTRVNDANVDAQGNRMCKVKKCATAPIHGCEHRSPEEIRRRERHCEEQHNGSLYGNGNSVNSVHKRGCDEIC